MSTTRNTLRRDLRAAGLISRGDRFDQKVEADLSHLAAVLTAAGWQPPPDAATEPAGGAEVDLEPASWIVRPAGSVGLAENLRRNSAGEVCEDYKWYLQVFFDRTPKGSGWAVREYGWTDCRMDRDGRMDFHPRHSGRPRSDYLWPTAAEAIAAARRVVGERTVNGWTFERYLEHQGRTVPGA